MDEEPGTTGDDMPEQPALGDMAADVEEEAARTTRDAAATAREAAQRIRERAARQRNTARNILAAVRETASDMLTEARRGAAEAQDEMWARYEAKTKHRRGKSANPDD